jgi:hypothetical protein
MKIAVMACGPSLVRHYPSREEFDVVVAVNTAGWLYQCDWLAFTDRHIIEPVNRGEYSAPLVGCLTNKNNAIPSGCERELLPIQNRNLKMLTQEMIELALTQGMTECAYTFPNALLWAGMKFKPDQLHVFGFDCAMTEADVAGVKGYHTRKRWIQELPWIRMVLRPFPCVILRCDAADDVKKWVLGKTDGNVEDLFPKA